MMELYHIGVVEKTCFEVKHLDLVVNEIIFFEKLGDTLGKLTNISCG